MIVNASVACSWPRKNCIPISQIASEDNANIKSRFVSLIRMSCKTSLSDVNGLSGRKYIDFKPSVVMPMAVLIYHKLQSLSLPKVVLHLRRPALLLDWPTC